ncbi:MAG: hypothetical protein ABI091_31535 [Ferruginibacter sp.]
MITEKQIEIAKALISTGEISQVYHSVELVEDKSGIKYPACKKGAEQYYVGPDDKKKMFAYIRQNGNVQTIEEILHGGCGKMYKVKIPLRIVVFHDHEKNDFDILVKKMLSFTYTKDISLLSFKTNAFQLGKEESPLGDFAFDATTFYLAIDVNVKMLMANSTCDEDACITHSNPICS